MNKLFWFDTETTGLDRYRNSMVQLAAMIEINGTIKEEINLFFRPLAGREIDQEALNVNGRTIAELMEFPPAEIGIASLKKTLAKYVNKFDREDKLIQVGFNVGFDCDFLRETWVMAGDRYGPGSYMFNCPWDIRSDVAKMIAKKKLRLKNYKLVTLCNHFGISTKGAHDALVDVRATRALGRVCEQVLANERMVA